MASSAPGRTEAATATAPVAGGELIRDRSGVGIIGCGGVTRETLGAFLDSGGRVAWVVDPSSRARESVIAQVSQRQSQTPIGYERVEDALRHGPDDCPVMINSPGPFHVEHVTLCAAARRPMLVAKPLGLDWGQTERALALADDAGVSIEVAEQYPDNLHSLQIQALLAEYGPARRVLFDHRKPTSAQTTLAGRRQTGIVEYAVHHYAVFAAWIGLPPNAIAVDSWNADGGRSGLGSIGHGWLQFDSCHVLHAFGFGGNRATYRAEIETDTAIITASGQHFGAADVRVRVRLNADGLAEAVRARASGSSAWSRLYARWLERPARSAAPADHRRIRIVAAMLDAALRAADSGSVVDLRSDARFGSLW